MLCPSVCGTVVNRHCSLYTEWSKYTEIVVKVTIEHIKVLEKIYKSVIIYNVYCKAQIFKFYIFYIKPIYTFIYLIESLGICAFIHFNLYIYAFIHF
jgi:hypothetical protein